MKTQIYIIILFIIFFYSCTNQSPNKNDSYFVTTDITNFWAAFDSVNLVDDSLQQISILNRLFINKASEGQKAMFEVRRYRVDEYLQAIRNYPNFWNSIRQNTLNADNYAAEMNDGVRKLKLIYPEMSNAKVYFTIGVFRSPGTTLDSMVLIGSEFALGDTSVVTTEFPENMQYAVDYYQTNPIQNITFLNVHEFVHTQQETALQGNLLTQSLREGTAEFITEKATGISSPSSAIQFGIENDSILKERFKTEMLGFNYANWLWSSRKNEFNIRDLGYYMGYAVANHYYEENEDKELVIKELIELAYSDDNQVIEFVNKVGYFADSIEVVN